MRNISFRYGGNNCPMGRQERTESRGQVGCGWRGLLTREHFSGWFEGEKGKLFIKHEGLWGTGEETTKLCYLEKLRKERGKGR